MVRSKVKWAASHSRGLGQKIAFLPTDHTILASRQENQESYSSPLITAPKSAAQDARSQAPDLS